MIDMTSVQDRASGKTRHVVCESCGDLHAAYYSHISQWGDQRVYAVVCDETDLTDYVTEDAWFHWR